MLDLVAKKMFLTSGKGVHQDQLTSFEYALRDAGIPNTNLVLISSIFPPGAKIISRAEGLKLIRPGSVQFVIYARQQSNEPHRLMAASVGLAEPSDKKKWGYLSEYHSFGETGKEAGDYAEDIAAQMLASSIGIPFDVDKNWDEKRQQWKVSGQIYKTRNITQSAIGDSRGRWTTVFAAAVLIL
ncbi:MAG: arginine decarboxylase, pyruvoyl-dependent [Thaumarchaeota archaeon]|jgi:arginine decarboxylase|nr:arginine decarboxylase, pyruvoyl-dependent [Nitrososphaerota archaeon]MBI3642034.1 arginine decarboxylase, pyruvoyl-dependent [Nitrososphaerota archaeon]